MPKVTLKVQAVIFDMDGVITDTMPYHFRAWKETFRKAGLTVGDCEIYLREGQPGLMTIKEIFHERGLTPAKEQAPRLLRSKEKLFKRIVHRRFISGARDFLRFLKQEGFTLGLVTGTSAHEVRRILPLYLLGYFAAVVTGDEVKKGKPHPEPYLSALKKLKLKPIQAVVVENAPFGICSAQAAGLRCLALETCLERRYLKDADLIFSSFKELRAKTRFVLDKSPNYTPGV